MVERGLGRIDACFVLCLDGNQPNKQKGDRQTNRPRQRARLTDTDRQTDRDRR